MFDYAPRYARVVKGLGFEVPTAIEELEICERLQGDASTDMGSLSGNAPEFDSKPLDEHDNERLVKVLEACWQALGRAAEAAHGKKLAKDRAVVAASSTASSSTCSMAKAAISADWSTSATHKPRRTPSSVAGRCSKRSDADLTARDG